MKAYLFSYVHSGNSTNALLQPECKGILKGKEYMYVYDWFILQCSRNEHNIVQQLYSNKN